MIWSTEVDEILKQGYFLGKEGVNNWALSKQQALKALDELLIKKFSILGGDVYVSRNDMFRPTYDNWYCDFFPEESDEEYLWRSIEKAKLYIEKYGITEKEDFYFVLVPNI